MLTNNILQVSDLRHGARQPLGARVHRRVAVVLGADRPRAMPVETRHARRGEGGDESEIENGLTSRDHLCPLH